LLAGTAIAPQWLTSCAAPAGKAEKYIGLQLYSLRDMVKDQGIQPVLEAVAKIGFKHVETAGYEDGKIYGLEPVDFRKRVEDLGMKCTSAHVGQPFDKEREAEIFSWWDKVIEAHNAVGLEFLIQPWMPVNEQTTLDDLKRYCDFYNAVGQKAAAAGIAFGYHNHDFEFKEIEGQRIFDFLLDNVSRDHVGFELDVYWCQFGGGDPVKYLRERPDQFKAVHIKDEKEIGASGKMDFKPIFDQMKANNIKNWYVEVEHFANTDSVAGLQESYDFLAKADYVY
jgi:sugar phosphate isomerase/epimerase